MDEPKCTWQKGCNSVSCPSHAGTGTRALRGNGDGSNHGNTAVLQVRLAEMEWPVVGLLR